MNYMSPGQTMKRLAQVAVLVAALAVHFGTLAAQPLDNVLPPAKQAIEDQYSQERASGKQNPAPSDPNAPLPTIQPPIFDRGVFTRCDAFPAAGMRTINCWYGIIDGIETSLYAGALTKNVDADGNEFDEPNPQQGVIVNGTHGTVFIVTPTRAGGLRIVAERNGVLTVVSETGLVWLFDVRTRAFTPVSSFKCPRRGRSRHSH
jgi:hypothetical protein